VETKEATPDLKVIVILRVIVIVIVIIVMVMVGVGDCDLAASIKHVMPPISGSSQAPCFRRKRTTSASLDLMIRVRV